MLTAARQVRALREALAAGRRSLDPEAVHDVRVAARRLLAFLALSDLRVLRDDLRHLIRGLGRLRDLDVALGAKLGGAFDVHLRRERELATAAAARLLSLEQTAPLLSALARLPAPGRGQCERAVTATVDEVGRREGLARRAQTSEALHALRKAIRRERYVKEWLGRETRALQQRQELVGVACDLASLQRLLVEAGERRGAEVVAQGLARIVPLLSR